MSQHARPSEWNKAKAEGRDLSSKVFVCCTRNVGLTHSQVTYEYKNGPASDCYKIQFRLGPKGVEADLTPLDKESSNPFSFWEKADSSARKREWLHSRTCSNLALSASGRPGDSSPAMTGSELLEARRMQAGARQASPCALDEK